jgi:hypothetical protein
MVSLWRGSGARIVSPDSHRGARSPLRSRTSLRCGTGQKPGPPGANVTRFGGLPDPGRATPRIAMLYLGQNRPRSARRIMLRHPRWGVPTHLHPDFSGGLPRMRHVGLGVIAFLLLGLGAPSASACGWLWPCAERPHASRAYRYAPEPYTSRPRPHRYRGAAWRYGYGYTEPPRAYHAYGYPYSAWSSPSVPPLRSALPGGDTNAVGLTPSVYGLQGLQMGALPARGPTLFGPQAAPAAGWGNYYGAPAYGYAPSNGGPPGTPSWWVEPRRRR